MKKRGNVLAVEKKKTKIFVFHNHIIKMGINCLRIFHWWTHIAHILMIYSPKKSLTNTADDVNSYMTNNQKIQLIHDADPSSQTLFISFISACFIHTYSMWSLKTNEPWGGWLHLLQNQPLMWKLWITETFRSLIFIHRRNKIRPEHFQNVLILYYIYHIWIQVTNRMQNTFPVWNR